MKWFPEQELEHFLFVQFQVRSIRAPLSLIVLSNVVHCIPPGTLTLHNTEITSTGGAILAHCATTRIQVELSD